MSKRTRDIDFHVYLSKKENQILENLCSRLRVNRSVLIRALILGKRLVEAPPVDYISSLLLNFAESVLTLIS